MSDTGFVNTALHEYFQTLSEQISAANRLKDVVTELLEKRDKAAKSGKGNLDEWDVLDQSYICIKLRNAFAEIDTKLETFKKNVSMTCKQKDKHRNYGKETQNTSVEVLAIILSIISELHQYHKTVAECIAPIVEYSAYRERYSTTYEMKECSSVPITWKAVNEVNRSLRYGYGLSKEDLAAILSWMHGEDLSESARKHLNLKVDGLILTYRERLSNLDSCEFDVPVAFQMYPLVLQDVIKDCCSPVESVAATGQALPTNKEDLETLIRREIPRVQVQIGDTVYDIASPGKAFENTKQKMVAVRHLVTVSAKSHKIALTKEQLDLFSLKVLATACISIANASARTAVLIAFGKANLIQVKPFASKCEEPAHISIDSGNITIEVPSRWSLTEDGFLLQSLSRDSAWNSPIATVDSTYTSVLNVKAEIQRQAQSLPVVRILRCSGIASSKGMDKKDPTSKGLRKRLSRATSKLFNRKSVHGMPTKEPNRQDEGLASGSKGRIEGIDNLGVRILDNSKDGEETAIDDDAPVPPPRPRRKARKKGKSEAARKQLRLLEEAKHDPEWFSSCKTLADPDLPSTEVGRTSVASFEELKEVIDLLSGSSTSSLSLNHPLDIERNLPQWPGSKKEEQLKQEIETKGKVSPSDSGIGSVMSVKSHPSVSSISKLQRNEHSMPTTCVEKDVTFSDKYHSSSCEQEAVSTKSNIKETSNIRFEEDSRQEDAEVEMLNDQSILQSNHLEDDDIDEGRDDDETPSNGKNTEFVNIQVDYSEDSSSESENEVQTARDKNDSNERLEDKFLERKRNDFHSAEERSELMNPDISTEHSYDADGSDQSEDNNPIQSEEAPAKILLHGSNESLYYSAWNLNENQHQQRDQTKTDDSKSGETLTTDSYFASGLMDSSLSETADTSEDFHECKEPDEMLYQHFNPRFSWPVGLGGHLAAIWGDHEVTTPQAVSTSTTTTTSNEIWNAEGAFHLDRGNDLQGRQNTPLYMVRSKQTETSSMLLSPSNWLSQRRRVDESFLVSSKADEHWSKSGRMPNREKEELRRLDWQSNSSNITKPERVGSNYHTGLQHLKPGDLQKTQTTQGSSESGWPSNSPHGNQGFQQYQGTSFGRPSSVPEMMSRPTNPHSPVYGNRQPLDNLERHAQSSGYRVPPSSQTAPTHFFGPQYQTWGRDVNSEPLLTASTKRSVSEYETLLLQHQRHQARLAARNIPQQYRGQKW